MWGTSRFWLWQGAGEGCDREAGSVFRASYTLKNTRFSFGLPECSLHTSA